MKEEKRKSRISKWRKGEQEQNEQMEEENR
jgi:hypothetical protein